MAAASRAAAVRLPLVMRGPVEDRPGLVHLVARPVRDDHKFAGLDLRFVGEDAVLGNPDTEQSCSKRTQAV